MALSSCGGLADIHDKELVKHGDMAFPIAVYHDDLPKYEVPWHWHDEWEYAIATEGNLEFLLENRRIQLHPGDGIFINARALHGVAGEGRLHSAVFHQRLIGGSADSIFHQRLVQPLLSDDRIRYLPLRREVLWENEVLQTFETAWQLMKDEPEDFELDVRNLLTKAMNILVKNCDFATTKLSEQELAETERIRTMLDYIENHYREDFTLQDLADQVSLSTSVCLRCFKKTLGESPMQYVKQYRIRKAADLLKTTNLTARDIALDCGFNDVSYFTKSFREAFGTTPREYRHEIN